MSDKEDILRVFSDFCDRRERGLDTSDLVLGELTSSGPTLDYSLSSPDESLHSELTVSEDEAELFRYRTDLPYPKGTRYHFVKTRDHWHLTHLERVNEDPALDLPIRAAPPDSAFVDRLPELPESRYNFVEAFEEGTEAWSPEFVDGKEVFKNGPLEVLLVGEEEIPSGTIMITEPMDMQYREPLPLRVPPGRYPVEIVRPVSFPRSVLMRIRFGDKPAIRHSEAVVDWNGDASHHVAILDGERAMTASEREWHAWAFRGLKTYEPVYHIPFRGADVIAADCQRGYGGWAIYWGLDEDGETVEAVVDFEVLVGEPQEALFSVAMPAEPSIVPLGTIPWLVPRDDGSGCEQRELKIGLKMAYEEEDPDLAEKLEAWPDMKVPELRVWSWFWFEETPCDCEILAMTLRWTEPGQVGNTYFPRDCFDRGGTIAVRLKWAQHRFLRLRNS